MQHFQIPGDLTGETVLDIGAYDGFYSFEAERRGAAHVVAADNWAWTWPGSDAQRNFDLAHDVLQARSSRSSCRSRTVSRHRGGHLDVVLFLGVLHHHPTRSATCATCAASPAG